MNIRPLYRAASVMQYRIAHSMNDVGHMKRLTAASRWSETAAATFKESDRIALRLEGSSMAEVTLENLAKRVEELERKINQRDDAPKKDWLLAAGMFTDSEFSRQIDEEARLIR